MSQREPQGFSWVLPGFLAAMGRPRSPVTAMEFLKDEGVEVIISLTEAPLGRTLIDEFGFDYHHIPVNDFTAPTAGQIDKFVGLVEKARRSDKKCVVHCLAGHGRTGTMLACYFVSRGKSAKEAVAEVRSHRPGSVETNDQEAAVERYALRVKRRAHKRK